MSRLRILLAATVLASLAPAGPPPVKRKMTGVVTESMCPTGDHSRMRMGPTDAQCAVECADAHGATWILYDGRKTWTLNELRAPEKWAGKKVTVTGAVDSGAQTIRVESVLLFR